MIPYPKIAPTVFEIGPFSIGSFHVPAFGPRWYGVMYLIGFWVGFEILKWRARQGLLKLTYREIEAYITHLIVGMLIGARLVYAFVYDPEVYLSDPVRILYFWQGGLSFHGAMIGMVVAGWRFGRQHRVPFYGISDAFAMSAAPGLFFGRMGNFINGELYGRATDVPWAMVFPTDPDGLPRHPSQLYQGLTEGLGLFCLLMWLQRRTLRKGTYKYGVLSAAFLIGYGVIRFSMEFFRQPDSQLGFVLGPFSMGQLLCFLMICWGLFVHWQTRDDAVVVPKPPTLAELTADVDA